WPPAEATTAAGRARPATAHDKYSAREPLIGSLAEFVGLGIEGQDSGVRIRDSGFGIRDSGFRGVRRPASGASPASGGCPPPGRARRPACGRPPTQAPSPLRQRTSSPPPPDPSQLTPD